MSEVELMTYRDRFIGALLEICGVSNVPVDLVDDWINGVDRDDDLQNWVGSYGPAWCQNIALLDAASVMADQPIDGAQDEIDYDRPNYLDLLDERYQLRQKLEAAEAQVKHEQFQLKKAQECLLHERNRLDSATARADKAESIIREAREHIAVLIDIAQLGFSEIQEPEHDEIFNQIKSAETFLQAAPVPAMPIQDDKPSLEQQLEFVTAERDGYRNHRDQLLEKLGKAPHWVEIDNAEDMPDDDTYVLFDGCDLQIDFADTEVDYGTTFFSNGTHATHYLANLELPKSEVKPS